MYRCMEKKDNKESCIRSAQCKDGLVCNSVLHGNLDGCGYPHGTRESKETCNFGQNVNLESVKNVNQQIVEMMQ